MRSGKIVISICVSCMWWSFVSLFVLFNAINSTFIHDWGIHWTHKKLPHSTTLYTRKYKTHFERIFFSSSQVYFRRLRVAKWNNYSCRKMSKSRTKVTCNFTRMTPFIFFFYSCSELHFGFRSYKKALMNEGKQKNMGKKNN